MYRVWDEIKTKFEWNCDSSNSSTWQLLSLKITKKTGKNKKTNQKLKIQNWSWGIVQTYRKKNHYTCILTIHISQSKMTYRPRGTLARTLYDKIHNDQYVEGYDMRLVRVHWFNQLFTKIAKLTQFFYLVVYAIKGTTRTVSNQVFGTRKTGWIHITLAGPSEGIVEQSLASIMAFGGTDFSQFFHDTNID